MKFNEELTELFKTINGIRIDGKTPSGLTGIIPLHDLLDLKDAVSYYEYMDWDLHWEMYEEIFETNTGLIIIYFLSFMMVLEIVIG